MGLLALVLGRAVIVQWLTEATLAVGFLKLVLDTAETVKRAGREPDA